MSAGSAVKAVLSDQYIKHCHALHVPVIVCFVSLVPDRDPEAVEQAPGHHKPRIGSCSPMNAPKYLSASNGQAVLSQ